MSDVNNVPSSTPGPGRVVAIVKAPVSNLEPVEKIAATQTVEQQQGEREQKSGKSDREALQQAVTTLNDYVQSIARDLEFSVDEELDEMVVKVIDSKSGEVIRQIPDQTMLELARTLAREGRVQLLDASG